jgi:hypothetical protein
MPLSIHAIHLPLHNTSIRKCITKQANNQSVNFVCQWKTDYTPIHPYDCQPIYLWLHSPLELGRFFSFLILYTVGTTPCTRDQPVAKPLPTHKTQIHNERTQTSMPRVGLETIPPVFDRAATVNTYDRESCLKQQRLWLACRRKPLGVTYMSTREQKSWLWISRRLKPGMTVLAKTSSNLSDLPTSKWILLRAVTKERIVKAQNVFMWAVVTVVLQSA